MQRWTIGLMAALLLASGCASPPPPPPPPPPVAPAPPPPPPDPTTFTASVDFDPGSAALTDTAVRKLADFAAKLQPYPERRVHVVGHSEASGADGKNPWLAEQRARSVASFLSAAGIVPEHLSLEGARSGGGGRTARVTVR